MVRLGSALNSIASGVSSSMTSLANVGRRAANAAQSAMGSVGQFARRAGNVAAQSADDLARLAGRMDSLDEITDAGSTLSRRSRQGMNIFDGPQSPFADNFEQAWRLKRGSSTPNLGAVDSSQMNGITKRMKGASSMLDIGDAPNPAALRRRPTLGSDTTITQARLDAKRKLPAAMSLEDLTDLPLKRPKLQIDTSAGGAVGGGPQTSAYRKVQSAGGQTSSGLPPIPEEYVQTNARTIGAAGDGPPSARRPGTVLDGNLLDEVGGATKKPRSLRPGKTATALATIGGMATTVANAVQVGQTLASLAKQQNDNDDDTNNITIVNNTDGGGGGNNNDTENKPKPDDKPKDPTPNQTDFRPVFLPQQTDVPMDEEEDLPVDARRFR